MQKFFASMLITTMLQMSVQTSRPSTGTEITTMLGTFSMIFCHCRIFEYVVADQIALLKVTDKITGNLAAHWVLFIRFDQIILSKKNKKKRGTHSVAKWFYTTILRFADASGVVKFSWCIDLGVLDVGKLCQSNQSFWTYRFVKYEDQRIVISWNSL